jgi:hypothetical protein
MSEKPGDLPASVYEIADKLIGPEGASFDFEWQGTRVPKTVTFPDGSVKESGYMRDGVMDFKDGTVVRYERVVDDLAQPNQKIRITFNPKE